MVIVIVRSHTQNCQPFASFIMSHSQLEQKGRVIPPTCPCSEETLQIGVLILADGSAYAGYSFGANISTSGECVFQTGMVGYPESLTDPSYKGQILIPTYPLIGNYGVPNPDAYTEYDNGPHGISKLPTYLESTKIHVSGLIVSMYSQQYSHHRAVMSLSDWLKKDNIPALYGLDTRALTKKIREHGVILGKLLILPKDVHPKDFLFSSIDISKLFESSPSYYDPNTENVVAQVSISTPTYYTPPGFDSSIDPTIMAVDTGMKINQIRCFLSRRARVLVVPWDYSFHKDIKYHGLFLSNGPGDPKQCKTTIQNLSILLSNPTIPIFGICLGHQILSLAAGAETIKMAFGNRGHNLPCKDLKTGRCYITSQNHGFAVQKSSLPSSWEELFINVNDGSNEGIIHKTLPLFSVQFHPEAAPGPQDTEFLFDIFLDSVKKTRETGKLEPLHFSSKIFSYSPSITLIKKVLILGSGGLSIGQAGEFDYSGSQAIKALKEEGIHTILINPNIATIQTSKGLADKVYFLPLQPEFVRKVIEYERPDGIYVTFGGQTALNVGVKMRSEFSKLGVQVLGTPIEAIIATEDRQIFADKLAEIQEKCAKSMSATNITEAINAAKAIGYPIICRAAYTLGGLGSGFANNESELIEICNKAFSMSPQVLIERSMKGWKEIEYEVVRDAYDNCITVCNMENFDPLGIHTGDSIVVAPSQTLSDHDYQMLRNTAIKVIRHLGVIGECNIQYALNPDTDEYCIIEVNARLSRSSALASKATGYPLAFVAAKLGLGIRLDDIKNHVTKVTYSCFEPSLDYCVVKIPRWDLKKFSRVSKKINSAMKSVGEVMAVGRCFEEAIQKGIRCLDLGFDGFTKSNIVTSGYDQALSDPSDERLFIIADAFYSGYTIDQIQSLTKIDKWFLQGLYNIFLFGKTHLTLNGRLPDKNILFHAKQLGFSDKQIASIGQTTELAVRQSRKEHGIFPIVKQIDTVAAEFPCATNYLYLTYSGSEHDVAFQDRGIIVLGSGVYRIGSSVEFDWCAVRCIRTLRSMGNKTIMINYNPETVSTDFDEVDRLYFENINLETALDIYERESSIGVIVSMGGQMPNNIALSLHRQHVRILGTSPEQIDQAENRYKFSRLLDSIGVDQPRWKELTSYDEAREFCDSQYPVLVRPSYVLSGAAMNVVFSEADLAQYLQQATAVSKEHPVVISKYIEEAKEIEMDAVAFQGKIVSQVITEHVENAGVHSGDATLILPPQDLDIETINKIELATHKIADALNVSGPMNIQFIAKNQEIKVIECNLRASRSFPFVSKVLDVDLVELATQCITGHEPSTLAVNPTTKLVQEKGKDYVAVKVPQFSFTRLSGADPVLGVEMASTGEVACFGKSKYEAYVKALLATGFILPKKKNILISIGSFKEKQEFLPYAIKLHQSGYCIFATSGTADFFSEHGIQVKYLEVLNQDKDSMIQKQEYDLERHLSQNLIDLYINLPSKNKYRRPANYMSSGYKSRRLAVDLAVPLITNIKCAKLFVEALARGFNSASSIELLPEHDCRSTLQVISLPGFINTTVTSDAYSESIAIGGVTIQFALEHVNLMVDRVIVGENSSIVYLDYSYCTPSIERDPLSQIFQKKPAIILVQYDNRYISKILLYSSIYNQNIHISDVTSYEDMQMICLARDNGTKVTFSIPIYSLFTNNESSNYFWKHLEDIPSLSLGVLENYNDSQMYCKMVLPRMIEAVQQGRLSIESLVSKLYEQPKRIFGIQEHSSMLEFETKNNTLLRSMIRGNTIVLDGMIRCNEKFASNIISINIMRKMAEKNQSIVEEHVHTTSGIVNLLKPSATFYGTNVLTVKQYKRTELHHIFNTATELRIRLNKKASSEGLLSLLSGKTLCNIFYEPSTRTSASFEAAMIKLGGQVIKFSDISSTSVAKGESLHDTIRTLGSYVDIIALRHPIAGSAQLASQVSPVPIINAGDGSGEHPTQALLDIFTIREELGTVNGLTVTLVGDLKYGRTVHSLVKLLSLYQVKLIYISLPGLGLPEELMSELNALPNVTQQVMSKLEDAISITDVLYMTRLQKERLIGQQQADMHTLMSMYHVDNKLMKLAKDHMIVMHPLPRNQEIDPEVDFDPRAAYFRQMEYGLYVRMALLYLLLTPDITI